MKEGYKKNKLQQLKLFCAVIEEGTILKAANKMGTAQPNVSLQIASLERSLKVCLFKREKQRLTPTKEALRFYKMCKKSIEEMDFLFNHAMQAIKEDYDNIIKISAHSYMLSHILPPYFKKMIEQNPKVKFELNNSSYTEAMDSVQNGLIDFAILPAKKEDLPKNIEMREFYKCKSAIIISKHHPLAEIDSKEINWNMLAKYDFLTLGKGITAQGLDKVIQNNAINSRFTLNNGTWEICAGIVNEGMTISGSDSKYLESFKGHADLIIKNCPWLLPEYEFFILKNTKTLISKSSADFISLLTKKI